MSNLVFHKLIQGVLANAAAAVPLIDFLTIDAGARIGNSVPGVSPPSNSYYGPNEYQLGVTTIAQTASWVPNGMLIPSTPAPEDPRWRPLDNKSVANASTWGSANGGGVKNVVIDLGQIRTFNKVIIHQTFSDGKVTDVALDISSTGNLETYTSPNWTQIFDFVVVGNSNLAGDSGTNVDFTSTTARYIRFRFKNRGIYNNPAYLEVYKASLFNV